MTRIFPKFKLTNVNWQKGQIRAKRARPVTITM
jgi:hypothetical protein